MEFKEAISQGFKKYVTFTGQARRSEYWFFILFYTLCSIAATIVDVAVGFGTSGLLGGLVALGFLIPSIRAGVRRLHDIDRTGWWMLIVLIPLIGPIVLLVFLVTNGTDGPNRFGADPKGPGSVVEEF